jgi:hypothetical protein
VLLPCRSGEHSAWAAETATKAGFRHVFDVLEGFEVEIDAARQRGGADGWRFHGLPRVQDRAAARPSAARPLRSGIPGPCRTQVRRLWGSVAAAQTPRPMEEGVTADAGAPLPTSC